MKKKDSKGFLLAETLIVTIFVSGVLIFLFMQFRSVSKSYDESFAYNTVDDLYALEDIKNTILDDQTLYNYITTNVNEKKYIDITDCSLFTNSEYCLKLIELSNIKQIFITTNYFENNDIKNYDEAFKIFISKVHGDGEESYRLIASFNDNTYASLRFGDDYE